jgi:RNA polymerase sigma factor (sigma-70 family)
MQPDNFFFFNYFRGERILLPTFMGEHITGYMAEPMDDLIPTRATLIQRLKNWQDQSSWQDFFDAYWRLIYGVALKGGLTEAEAQDVVQETMISVAKHMPTFKYDPVVGSFKTWLLNMTRWRITDQLRKRGPAYAASQLASDDTNTRTVDKVLDPASPALDALWNTEWEKNLLDAALARVRRRLDPQKYQIFDLYVNKGWPPEKVATTLGISVDQVYLAKHRTTEMIREEVKRLEQKMV